MKIYNRAWHKLSPRTIAVDEDENNSLVPFEHSDEHLQQVDVSVKVEKHIFYGYCPQEHQFPSCREA